MAVWRLLRRLTNQAKTSTQPLYFPHVIQKGHLAKGWYRAVLGPTLPLASRCRRLTTLAHVLHDASFNNGCG